MTQKQIIEHIERKGKQKITITPRLIFYWWKEFNEVLFNNELAYPNRIFNIRPKNQHLGWVCYNTAAKKYTTTLALNFVELPTRRWFYAILVHEMAHIYTDVHYPNERYGHGPRFKEWIDPVNALGLPFSRLYNIDDFDNPTLPELI